jgi:hypothetical protein
VCVYSLALHRRLDREDVREVGVVVSPVDAVVVSLVFFLPKSPPKRPFFFLLSFSAGVTGGRPEDFIEAVALILGTSFIGLGSNFLSFADMGAASISLACNYYSQNTTRVREGAQLTHKTSQHNEDADT